MGDVVVSAIIPTRNRANYVAQAVSSCLAQTYPCHEVIVVDDGSTDDTRQTLGQFGARIRLVHQQNSGVSAARNRGIRMATGNYIAFLDDDDLWVPQKLERQVHALMQAPSAEVVYSNFSYIPTSPTLAPPSNPNRAHPSHMLDTLLMGDWLATDTLLIRKDCLLAAGLFDEGLRAHEDWYLLLTLAERYEWLHVPEELTLVLWHHASLTKDVRLMDDTTWRMLDKYFASASGARLPRSARRRAYSAAHYRIAMHYIACAQYVQAAWHMGLGFTTAPERLLLERSKIAILLSNVVSRGYRRAPGTVTEREKREHQ